MWERDGSGREGRRREEDFQKYSRFLSGFVFADVMVWTNDQVIKWVESIGLESHAPHLQQTGVHGGVLALDNDFDHEKLAMSLQIPLSNTEVGSVICIIACRVVKLTSKHIKKAIRLRFF